MIEDNEIIHVDNIYTNVGGSNPTRWERFREWIYDLLGIDNNY